MKQLQSKASFWLFCAVMTFLYGDGLFRPEASGYWLAKFGFAVLILEFFSVFAVIALLELAGRTSGRRSIGAPIFIIVVVTLLAFAFCWLADLRSFAYFLVAIPVKFVAFRRIQTAAESREKLRSAVVTGSAIVSSALVAALLAKKYAGAFHARAELLSQHLVDSGAPLAAQTSGDFLVFLGFWGILHYSLSVLFDLGVEMDGAR